MRYLLEKLGVLLFKYEKLKANENFNIFPILRDIRDEVNLHSKFISELLDSEGTHGEGRIFSRKFVEELQMTDFDLENYSVYREYKNIDILLCNSNQAIIVENKIWAPDQDRQLERYYKILKEEGYKDIWIVYLSLNGKEPESSSLGTLKLDEDIQLVSYSYHILKWIEQCVGIAAKNPSLRETLIQYQRIICEITGKTMNNEQQEDIIELLRVEENIIKAQLIVENWDRVRWQTEFEFWCDLEKIVSEKYKVLENQKFSKENLDTVVYQSRKRNYWYGIMFKIADYKGAQMCLFIERGNHDLYYGVTMLDQSGNREITNDKKFNEFSDFLKEQDIGAREDLWLGWNYLDPSINFENFSDPTTLKLINKQNRDLLLKQYWSDIQGFAKLCLKGTKAKKLP